MKIYTKTGDEGSTGLFGGKRLPKDDLRIEAYGTVDELNAHIGLLRDHSACAEQIETLLEIQDRLFTMGSLLATDPEKSNLKLPQLAEDDILRLENEIDKMNELLPEMKSFVLPGGHQLVSFCHIARCVCRRAERRVVTLTQIAATDSLIIKYLNRLSDYLFVLSRMLSHKLNAPETPWKPRM